MYVQTYLQMFIQTFIHWGVLVVIEQGLTDYISVQGFADMHHVTKGTVRGWKERHWTKGKEYFVVGKTTLIDKTEAIRWLDSQKALNSVQVRSGLSSTGRVSGSRRLIQGSAMHST